MKVIKNYIIAIFIAILFVSINSSARSLLTDDGKVLIDMKAFVALSDGSRTPLDFFKTILDRDVIGNYNVMNVTLKSREADVQIQFFNVLNDEDRLFINNVRVMFKRPTLGYNACFVDDINGYRGLRVKCLESRQFDCHGRNGNNEEREASKFAKLVIDFLEYEFVLEGNGHKSSRFQTEPAMCYGY